MLNDDIQYAAKQALFDAEIEDKHGSVDVMHDQFKRLCETPEFQAQVALASVAGRGRNGIDNPLRTKRK